MKKNNSTQELVGIKSFSRNGLVTDKGDLVFFLVNLPTFQFCLKPALKQESNV
jgi:hypothetical protein